MPGITVVGLDSAGGTQLGGSQTEWTVEGQPIVLLGDAIAPHPPGGIHLRPVMAQGSAWMTLNGKPVVHAGNQASCGHGATGRPWFTIE